MANLVETVVDNVALIRFFPGTSVSPGSSLRVAPRYSSSRASKIVPWAPAYQIDSVSLHHKNKKILNKHGM
jgi:hypothetical protein